MKINLKHKMKDEVSLVDKTDRSGAVKSEKPCQQPSTGHRELVGARHAKYEYNYDHAQGNNLSTII